MDALEKASCFREAFLLRLDPKTREAMRLFGRLLDDLALERSLTENGAHLDALLEFRGLTAELVEMAEGLESLRDEMEAAPVDPTEPDLVALARWAVEEMRDIARVLREGLERSERGERGKTVPFSRRRQSREYLRVVPESPNSP